MTSSQEKAKPPRTLSRRLLRVGAAVFAVVLVSWLAVWLTERSLKSNSNRRGMQSWLDDNLNADVSLLGELTVRLNLIRRSRLELTDVEVEHPNPIFSGKFATVERMGAWCLPWSILGLWPGHLDLLFQGVRLTFEENDVGEWSSDGLLRPLSPSDVRFPFPVPKVSGWTMDIRNSALALRRHGCEFVFGVDATAEGRANRDRAVLQARKSEFSYGRADSDERVTGKVGPATLAFRIGDLRTTMPEPIPGSCEARVESLPVASLPFFLGGIPMADAPGVYNGLVRFQEHPGAAGALFLEGELKDVPLTVFGLPRTAPVRVVWPVGPAKADTEVRMHLGPSGFGAFEMSVPLDASGLPRLLAMRGDVAALDDLPNLFSRHSRWPDWLSRTFPVIEWRSGKWLGFGWSGSNMQLRLSRSTAGLNLTGEAEVMNGRVRIAVTPEQEAAPINIAAERLDAQLLAVKLSQSLPAPFKAQLSGSHVNLTWRGMYSAGEASQWGGGLVFAKPEIDLAASGSWWRGIPGIASAIAQALPEWGGGNAEELLALAKKGAIRLDQLSIVTEKDDEGVLAVEFRAYGDSLGQATGMIECGPDGGVAGEFFLAGPSQIIAAAEKANLNLGQTLSLMANDSLGLRVAFRADPGKEPEFFFPFLKDARQVLEDLKRGAEEGKP